MRERRRRWLVVVTLVSALGTTVPPAHAATPSATAGPALTVDVAGDRHAISREIYGVNHADGASARSLGLTVDRMGGNAQTRYNYQTGFHNTGSDWYFENIPPASTSTRPHDAFIQKDRAAGMRTIIQVPLIGWTPKAPSPASHPFACGFKVSKYGAQQGADWQWDPDCGNGTRTNGTPVTGNDPTDTSTAIDSTWVKGWVQALVGRYRTAADGGVRHYELDNEPALWNSTHRDVHPAPVTYDELRTRTVTYAAAVKAADAGALTLGPSDWGWCAYFYSAPDGCSAGADHAAHGNRDFAPWYLAQLRAASQSAGRRLLDYFDEHYYPQSGVALRDAGDASMRALRLRSTRSLWDPITWTSRGSVATSARRRWS